MTGDWLYHALLAAGIKHRDADLCVERAAMLEFCDHMPHRNAELEAQLQALGRVVIRPAEAVRP